MKFNLLKKILLKKRKKGKLLLIVSILQLNQKKNIKRKLILNIKSNQIILI